ncbi:relaxosome accessory protein [Salmonella enterica]|nr:relaxosome accessory protein [Salmonella enterica]EDU3770899.1 relaxosome accessory protein [Salmonella enterica subsp. enterica serovar Minnesota]EDX2839286.1 relaxosome accessory protein [Salmonella enterica subsp. enterica serovar Berta]
MTKKISFKERTDEREVLSPVLNEIPENLHPIKQSDCHVCPNAVWFTDFTEDQDGQPVTNLSCYCKYMNTIIYQRLDEKKSILIDMCDGCRAEPEDE